MADAVERHFQMVDEHESIRRMKAAMIEEERQRTMTLGEPHWLRKAGKDLFDASFLLRDHASLDEVRQVAPADMWSKISEALHDIPLPLRAFAETMAERAKVGDVVIVGLKELR